MKNKNNIRALTGMSQENLALLLQVSRSQIAMFESGKRNLPIQAMEKLALLLTLSQKESTTTETKKATRTQEQEFLQNCIVKNKHQQLLVARKITSFIKKQERIAVLEKMNRLIMQEEKNLKNYDLSLLKYRTTKNQTQPNFNTQLVALQLKKKVLEYEEQLIKEQLKETNSLLTKDKKTK